MLVEASSGSHPVRVTVAPAILNPQLHRSVGESNHWRGAALLCQTWPESWRSFKIALFKANLESADRPGWMCTAAHRIAN